MAENNELSIVLGAELDMGSIRSQLAEISKSKDNKIVVQADTSEAKKTIKELKDELKNSKSPTKIAIDVLKGQSNTNIGNFVKEIQDKYQSNPIKITLDVDKNATAANINKAVGEIQQQVQKAVDQATKVNSNIKLDTTTSSAGVQLINTSQIKEARQELEGTEGIIKRIQSGIMQGIGNTQQFQANTEIEKFNQGLGKTVTVYKELNEESSKLAGAPILEEVSRTYETNFQKMEQEAQKLDNALSKVEANFNKLQLSAKPLTGQFADKANDALAEYLNKYIETMQSGKALSAEQSRQLDEVRAKTSLVIQEQTALQKAYERTLIEVQKQQNALETTYAKAFDKNATKTLFFENGDVANQRFAQPVIDQYKEIKNLLAEIENNARNSGLAITTEQTNQLSEAFAKLNIVISEQKNARWTATNFKETDTASFVERYKNMMVELSNALKDDGVYDRFQTKISELFATLNNVKSGDASTGDFLNQLRNIKQEINTFESSVKGRGVMAAFDISEDQLTRIKSLGKALSGQENTQGIEDLKQRFADLGKAYEELQTKMQAKGISRDRLNGLEAERDALDKELQSLSGMVNNLNNSQWVSSQQAGLEAMKTKFAEYREEISRTVELTPELKARMDALAATMSGGGAVDVANWKEINNEFKTLQANVEAYKNSIQGQASQMAIGISQDQIAQLEKAIDLLSNLNVASEHYDSPGVKSLIGDLNALADEYARLRDQLKTEDLGEGSFKKISREVEDLDTRFKQLIKEAATFGNQNSMDKFTASTNGLKLNLEKLEKQYASLIAKNPEFANRVEELKQKLESIRPGEIPSVSKEISNLSKEMANASGQSAGLRGALQDAFGGLGSYIARFTSSYYLISKTIQGIKKMVNAVKEVDTSLVELQKVTNLTGDSLTSFTDKAYEMGAQLGRTGKDVIDAATTFSRAGYDLNEATQLAQSALVMTNVGVDIPNMESAASDMISILKAFDIQAEESMDVIDKLYNVANKEPLDFGNITQMLVTAGGTLAQSGTKLEESMGLLTGAFATLRNSSVANGLIFISQRLRGLDEDGEAIDGLIPKLQSLFSSVGINIEDQNGELRSTFDILQDLAGVWDQLSSKQKQYFGEKVAGNRQVKTLNAIMQNWDVVADTIDKANNAQGEALKGNEMYMDSIEGRMTQLQSAFQELARTTIDSNFVKGIVSLGTNAIKLVNDLGGLPPILTTILGIVLAIKGADIVGGIAKIGSALAGLFSSFSLAAGLPGILIAVAGAIALVVNHIDSANSSLAQFDKAKESYEEHKTKVESLNGELKTTEDRIAELEGKESLTIVEQEELNRLKDVNQELRDQIELEKTLQNIALGSERKSAADYLETKMVSPAGTYNDTATKYLSFDYLKANTSGVDHTQMRNFGSVTDAEQLMPNFEEKINADMAALDAMLERYREVQKEIRETREQGGDTSLLTQEKNQLDEDITTISKELEGYYKTINDKTKDFDVVEDAIAGSAEDRINQFIAYRKKIEDALVTADSRSRATTADGVREEIDEILGKYPEEIAQIQEEIKEQGDNWQFGIPDSVKQKAKQDQDEVLAQATEFIKTFDGLDDGDVHATLGEVLEKRFNTGNVDVLARPILHAADLVKAGWEELKGAEDDIATYYSSSNFELKDLEQNIQYAITATPIDADGNVLSPEQLDDYIWKLIDESTSIEDLMAKDSTANGGKGLILHYTPAVDMSPEALSAAFEQEVDWAQLLHTLDAAFEQALLDEKTNGTDSSQSVAEYLRGLISAAIEDPSLTGQVLTEIYAVAKALAVGGNDAVVDALGQVNIPEAIEKGMGISSMTVDDIGGSHFDALVEELMRRMGFSIEQIRQLLQEKYGNEGIQIDIGPQMDIDVSETIDKLFQNTDAYTKVLTKALSEQEKAGQLTAATISSLLSESGLPGIADCLEKTADGYRLNTDRVNEYINAQNEDIRLNAIAGIMERQAALADLSVKYGDAAMAEWALIDSDNGLIDAQNAMTWQNEIAELQIVADEAYNATDALEALRQASKTPDEDADHTEAQGLLKKTQEAIDAGKLGTDDFKEGLDYLLGEGWYERFNGDLDKAIAAFESKKKKFFADDDADSANNFMNALVDKGLASRDKASGEFNLLTDDITKVANALGISETAAQDLFELLNSYSYDNKFTFGENAITSAEELEVAEKKLSDVKKEMEQTDKDLQQAEKELEEARGTSSEDEKKKKVEELKNKYAELEKESKDLSDAINTANEAVAGDMEPPKTLDDALDTIQKLQSAIDTLTKENINIPVELPKALKSIIDYISNPSNTLTLNVKPGEIDSKVEELVEFKESIDKNPNIEPSVKATISGLTETAIAGLERFEKTSKELEGTNINPTVTVGHSGFDQATILIQGLSGQVDNLEDKDPTVDVKVQEDEEKNAKSLKEGMTNLFNDDIEADVQAKATGVEEADKALDDVANKKRTATINTVVGDLAQAYADSHQLEPGKEYSGSGNPFTDVITYLVGGTTALENLTTATNENTKAVEESNKGTPADSSPTNQSRMDNLIGIGNTFKDLGFPVEDIIQAIARTKEEEEALRKALGEGIELKTSDSEVATVDTGVKIDEEEWQKSWDELVGDELEAPVKPDEEKWQESWDELVGDELDAPIDIDEENVSNQVKEGIEKGADEAKPKGVVVEVIQKVKEGKVTAKDINQTVNVKGKDAGGTKAVQNVQKEAQKGATIPIDANTTEATNKDDALKNRIETKAFKPVGLAADYANDLDIMEKRMAQPVEKKVYITYEERNTNPAKAKGTKNAEGGLTLVDEKGAELIEHTKQGTFELGSNDGARFAHLDKGDVVHTADETKKILSRMGGISGIIKSGFNTVKSFIGNAFASGTVRQTGPMTIRPKKKKDDTTSKKTRTTPTSSTPTGSQSSSSSSSSSNNDELSKWTEWSKKFFDWVEIKLKRLKEATQEFTEEAARAVGVWAKNRQLKNAMNSIEEEIAANEAAYKEYIKMTDNVLAHGYKLNNDIIQKIINGTIDISQYDDVTQKQIKDYQTWYEKAQACLKTITQLKDQQKELAKQRLANIVNEYSAYAKIYESEQNLGSATRYYNETIGKATEGSNIADEYFDNNGNINIYKDQEKFYDANLDAFTRYSESLKESADAVENSAESFSDSAVELEDGLYLLDNISDHDLETIKEIESFDPTITSINGDLVGGELLGQSGRFTYIDQGREYGSFSEEIHAAEAKASELQEAREKLQKELSDLMRSGTVSVGDDTWLEYTNKIKELDKDVIQTKADIEKFKDAANDAALIPFRNQIEDFSYEVTKANQEMELGNARGSLSRSGKRDTYASLIENAAKQNKNLEVQNILYRKLQEGLDVNSQKYIDFEKKIRDNEAAMASNAQSIEEYKKALIQLGFDDLDDELNNLTNDANKLTDSISNKMLRGIEITEGAYRELIQNGKDQIENLTDQKKAYQYLMDQLVAQYGEAAKTSDLYLEYQDKVNSLDASIRTLDSSVIQWNKDMQNLAVEKVGWQLDAVKNSADELNSAMSFKKASGQAINANDYKSLISNAKEQNKYLEEQNRLYEQQQIGMDINSQAYQELEAKIRNNTKAIDNNMVSIEQWDDAMKELPIEKMAHKIDLLKVKSDQYNETIKQRELIGKRITASYYQSLINNANSEINVLKEQASAYRALMDELVKLYGAQAYESDVYKEYEKQLNDTNKEIDSLTTSTIEWGNSIEDIPIEELGWKLDALNEKFNKTNNLMSLNEAQGVELTSKVYSDLIKNGSERIKLLEEENKLLVQHQKNMDVNSKAYQDLQKQIASNNDEIASIKVSQEQWNDSIVDLGIKNIQKYKDSISKSNEQLQRQKDLQQAIQDLEKASSQRKVRTYVEGQGFVYQRDEDDFRKAQENLEDVIRNQLMDKLDDLIDALEESKKDTNVYDKNGNFIGSTYNTPQLGNLVDILTNYYNTNNGAVLDVNVLKDALGKDIVSNINPQNKNTSFSIGDITINEVKDGNELAKAIVDQFPNALLQALYSK